MSNNSTGEDFVQDIADPTDPAEQEVCLVFRALVSVPGRPEVKRCLPHA